MPRRRTKPKKAFKREPLTNLCLDLKLPDGKGWFERLYMQQPFLPSLIDRPIRTVQRDWTPGLSIQAQDRLSRTINTPVVTSTLSTAAEAGRNAALSMDVMKRHLDKIKDSMASRMNSLYAHQMLGRPNVIGIDPGGCRAPGDFDRPEDVGMVDALKSALSRYGEEVDMTLMVTQPLQQWPEFVDAWLWGPLGEFTGFARPDVLDKIRSRICVQAAREGVVIPYTVHVGREPVHFKVTVLSTPRHRHFNEPAAMFQFNTYADYALWEDMASYDRTPIHGA